MVCLSCVYLSCDRCSSLPCHAVTPRPAPQISCLYYTCAPADCKVSAATYVCNFSTKHQSTAQSLLRKRDTASANFRSCEHNIWLSYMRLRLFATATKLVLNQVFSQSHQIPSPLFDPAQSFQPSAAHNARSCTNQSEDEGINHENNS